MKRIVIKGYTCPACQQSVRVAVPGTYVRCSCGNLAVYGNPQDPVIVCNLDARQLDTIDTIAVVPDNYRCPENCRGGVVLADPKKGKMVGIGPAQMDLILPLLAFSHAMRWDSHRLFKAFEAFEEYDALISGSL
jgi:hypothetical protein